MNKSANRAERHDLKIIGEVSNTPKAGEVSKPFLCNTINMSLTGALVETSHSIKLGALLNYSFRLPGANDQVKVLTEVVRCKATDSKSTEANPKKNQRRKALNIYGIRFLEVKKTDLSAIKAFLLA